jgi:hypothetical protein
MKKRAREETDAEERAAHYDDAVLEERNAALVGLTKMVSRMRELPDVTEIEVLLVRFDPKTREVVNNNAAGSACVDSDFMQRLTKSLFEAGCWTRSVKGEKSQTEFYPNSVRRRRIKGRPTEVVVKTPKGRIDVFVPNRPYGLRINHKEERLVPPPNHDHMLPKRREPKMVRVARTWTVEDEYCVYSCAKVSQGATHRCAVERSEDQMSWEVEVELRRSESLFAKCSDRSIADMLLQRATQLLGDIERQ